MSKSKLDQKLCWLTYFFHACKCMLSGVFFEVSFWHLRTKLALKFSKWSVQTLDIPHFKDFFMMHLKYEIRIFPKSYIKDTITLYFYYEIRWITLYMLKHVRGTTPSLASRLAMTWGQSRPNLFKNPEFCS